MTSSAEDVWNRFFEKDSFGEPCIHYEWIFDTLASQPRVLDIGCGNGRNILPYMVRCSEVVGIDPSGVALRRFHDLAPSTSSLLLINSKIEGVDLGSLGDFDLVIAHGVLHLVEEQSRQRVMKFMRRATKPNGINTIVAISNEATIEFERAMPGYNPISIESVNAHYAGWKNLLSDRTEFAPTDSFPMSRSTHRSVWQRLP